MAADNDNIIRINIKLDREIDKKFTDRIPRGNKSGIIRAIILRAIYNLEHDDAHRTFYSALVRGEVDIIPLEE